MSWKIVNMKQLNMINSQLLLAISDDICKNYDVYTMF